MAKTSVSMMERVPPAKSKSTGGKSVLAGGHWYTGGGMPLVAAPPGGVTTRTPLSVTSQNWSTVMQQVKQPSTYSRR
jgi:hypothetical protein